MNIILTIILVMVWYICGLIYCFSKKESHERWQKRSKINKTLKTISDALIMGPLGVVFIIMLFVLDKTTHHVIRDCITKKKL